MSVPYVPGRPPEKYDAEWTARESAALNKGLQGMWPNVLMEILHMPPERIVAGMLILADGVDFDPGSGEGLYRRDKTNTTWVFIG